MRILIQAKPYHQMRYPTLGDWYQDGHGAVIDVADVGDWRMNLLIALHEMVESALCEHAGIPESEVLAFDKAHPDLNDPGADPAAPYQKQHLIAERMERFLAAELGVDWKDYEAACDEAMK
jgi:hypothetical protein